jgi:hypothetical protein
MNKLIYFFVLILFLILIKTLVFTKEGFHPSSDDAHGRSVDQQTEHQAEHVRQASLAVFQQQQVEIKRNEIKQSQDAYDAALQAAKDIVNNPDSTEAEVNESVVEAQEALEILNGHQRDVGIDDTEFEDPTITTPPTVEDEPLTAAQEQERRVGVDHNLGRVTVQSDIDKQCCGVSVFDPSLINIGKCVSQHIAKTGELENPTFLEWKEPESECKNPHRILSRTSNCSDIVTKYNPSIKTLIGIINDTSCEKCDYLRYIQDLSSLELGELTDNQKLLIFQKRIACDLRGLNEIGDDKLIINDNEFEINECGEPNGSVIVGGCN